MYIFVKDKLRNLMAQHHHTDGTMAREFKLRHMDISFRTISRWRSDKTLNHPSSSQMRVLLDIAKGLDKSIKFEDFFKKKWEESDKIG
tara:strand:+ start:723 stop:986 length:264 start_codon:yes stop_codon:yes gene_type:complete